MDGLPLQWAVAGEAGSVYQYFYASAIGAKVTLPDFYAAGGIELDRDPAEIGDDFTEHLLTTLGDRAVKVEIGSYTGALVWADPLSNGIRPHHLYWTDGTWNYVLMANVDPQGLVTIGRGLVCGGKVGI